MISRGMLLLSICLPLCVVESSRGDEAEARRLVEQIIQSRRALDPAHIRLETSVWKLKEGELRQHNHVEYDCHVSGAALSMDRTTYGVDSAGQKHFFVRDFTIKDSDGKLISETGLPQGQKLTPSIVLPEAANLAPQGQVKVWDARTLGLANQHFATHHVFNQEMQWEEAFFGRPGALVSVDVQDNRIHSRLAHGDLTVELSPDCDFQPVNWEFRSKNGATEKTEIQLHNWSTTPEHTYWFPKHVTYVQESPPGVLKLRSECIVLQASFRQDIPDSQFSVAALDLEPGREIKMTTPSNISQRAVWNGEELTTGNSSSGVLAPVASSEGGGSTPTRFQWLLYLNSALLAALGLIFLWRSKQRASQSVQR